MAPRGGESDRKDRPRNEGTPNKESDAIGHARAPST
jgi:hypothetical protein